MAPTLGYWKIRGLAQQIRFLLHYLNVEYEDKTYETGPAWFDEDKFKLGLDFPNIPYYIDGNVKLSQSTAIMRYIAHKHNLDGNTEEEKVRVMLAESQLVDLRTAYAMVAVFAPKAEFEAKKEAFVKTLPEKLKQWTDFFGANDFIAGNKPTYVDFMLYELLYQLSFFVPGYLDGFGKIADYVKRVQSLPGIAKFRASPKYIEKPFFGPIATWDVDKK